MSAVNTDWFKRRIEDRDLSQRKIGSKMGLDGSAINLMIHGRRKVSASEATQIADILGAPIAEVFENFGIEFSPLGSSVQVVAVMDDKGYMTARPQNKRQQVPLPGEMPRGTVAARNEDPASLRYGWTYYYLPGSNVAPEALGRMSICTLKDGRKVCGHLRPGFRAGEYNLIADGDTIEDAKLTSATPVLWIRAG